MINSVENQKNVATAAAHLPQAFSFPVNPCIDCALCGKGVCSWDKDLEPVDGWKATRVMRASKNIGYAISYCPMFVQDKTILSKSETLEKVAAYYNVSSRTVARRPEAFIYKYNRDNPDTPLYNYYSEENIDTEDDEYLSQEKLDFIEAQDRAIQAARESQADTEDSYLV